MHAPLQIGGPDDPLAPVWQAAREAAGDDSTYAVGGPVRDMLRGSPSRDADIAVEGDPSALAGRLAGVLGGARVTLHRAFGTAVVRTDGVRIDVAATRTERYPRPAALPVVAPAGIDADLGRRDFTVNALAAAITGPRFGELLDPFGGRADLEARVIRVLHPASFRDDPTRLVRAVRYAARLGFTIDPETERLAREAIAVGLVDALSGARVRAELGRTSGRVGRHRRGRAPPRRRSGPAGLRAPRAGRCRRGGRPDPPGRCPARAVRRPRAAVAGPAGRDRAGGGRGPGGRA